MKKHLTVVLVAMILMDSMAIIVAASPEAPLVLEATIQLKGVTGRIDHMAIDLGRKRLLVAELGNDTVEVIDLASHHIIHRIDGLKEPQGVGFVPSVDVLVVTNAGDGSVRFYRGQDFAAAGKIDLGVDADNVHVDPSGRRIVIGYGSGGLAIIDPVGRVKIGDIKLAAHPEGFQLAPDGSRAFVNVPDARQIAVVDLASGHQTAAWTVPDARSNFPMAIDVSGHVLASIFRNPARLVLINTATGELSAQLETCGDADDVFFDAKRHRIYVSCGAGTVDVFEEKDSRFSRIARIKTESGGRTSLFVPELDRLFVAVRTGLLGDGAKILVFRPTL